MEHYPRKRMKSSYDSIIRTNYYADDSSLGNTWFIIFCAYLKGIKEKHSWEITHVFYSNNFSLLFLSQGVLFTSVETPLYLYFIAFVVPSKVLIEFSARFGFLHKNRFSVSQIFPSPFCPSCPRKKLDWSENCWAWFLYVYKI